MSAEWAEREDNLGGRRNRTSTLREQKLSFIGLHNNGGSNNWPRRPTASAGT